MDSVEEIWRKIPSVDHCTDLSVKNKISTNQYFFPLILPPSLPQRIWQNMNLWIVKTSIAFIVCYYHILLVNALVVVVLQVYRAVLLYSSKQISLLQSEVHPVPVCLRLPPCELTGSSSITDSFKHRNKMNAVYNNYFEDQTSCNPR